MRRVIFVVAILALCLFLNQDASAYTKTLVPYDGSSAPFCFTDYCTLQAYNICSGWIWVVSDLPGAVWGVVLDPNDCPGGCANGGFLTDIWFWSRGPAGHTINGVDVDSLDASGCPARVVWQSGPIVIEEGLQQTRWTHVPVTAPGGGIHLNGQPYSITLEFGEAEIDFGTDNGIGNLFCWLGFLGTFPGCQTTTPTCTGWGPNLPPQVSYIYIGDVDGDTQLEDICSLYGAPHPLWSPPVYGYPQYGYLPNNLLVRAALDCVSPTGAENTSWGRVKALYE